ncbi:MAG: GAF domain-containing protein [Betaproteobacteria bacterium]|nr:GAF domain-containing protein [Betaproteobacteria bacterium]
MLLTPDRDVEMRRLAAVRRYEILDTPPDGAFDRVAELAARIFDVPVAIISIVDHDRIWFKSHHGVSESQVGRDPGLCASAILRDEVTVIPDARRDPVALTNPLVAGKSGFCFYTAAPLRTADGHNLGTLCVLDTQPREVTDNEKEILRTLAAIVVDQMELRLSARRILG